MKWILIAELFSYVYRHKLVSTARKRKGLKKEGLVYVHLTNVLSSSHCYTFQHRYRSISARILLLRLICWSYSRLNLSAPNKVLQAVPETATICPRPLQVDNIFVSIRHVAPVPACWLFKT